MSRRAKSGIDLRALAAAGVVATAGVLTIVACQPSHVPADVQRQLPLRPFSFSGLCPRSGTTPADRRRIGREAEVLLHELHRRPSERVTITDPSFEDGHAPYDISVRELAEQRRDELITARELAGRDCSPRLRQRLIDALRDR